MKEIETEIKNSKKWVYDKVNSRVVTEDDSELVFYTNELTCHDEVIDEVVKIQNDNTGEWLINSGGAIDDYLLDAPCTTEDMQLIVESIYIFYAEKVTE